MPAIIQMFSTFFNLVASPSPKLALVPSAPTQQTPPLASTDPPRKRTMSSLSTTRIRPSDGDQQLKHGLSERRRSTSFSSPSNDSAVHVSSENRYPEKEDPGKDKLQTRERAGLSLLRHRASSLLPRSADTLRTAVVDMRGSSKKGVKRKRSAASSASDASAKLSKRLSGLTSRATKKQHTSATPSSNESLDSSAQMVQEEPEPVRPVLPDENDIHGALRVGGKRLVGYSLDTDDLSEDKPDDCIISIPSILQLLSGEPAPFSPSNSIGAVKRKSGTVLYHMWFACRSACIKYPFGEKAKYESGIRERRIYHALQVFIALVGLDALDRLPSTGYLHVPVDPRLSNNAVQMVDNVIRLHQAFQGVGIPLNRIIIDIPATNAGILAGRYISTELRQLVNYTMVCELGQAAACLKVVPYGLSISKRIMKAADIERSRTVGTSLLFNYMEQSAEESTDAIARLVALAGRDVLVSIRDLDTRESVATTSSFGAVSLIQPLVVQLRWHAHRFSLGSPLMDIDVGASKHALYADLSDGQKKKADAAARASYLTLLSKQIASTSTDSKGTSEQSVDEVCKIKIREKVQKEMAVIPRLQRRYVDATWLTSTGLEDSITISDSMSWAAFALSSSDVDNRLHSKAVNQLLQPRNAGTRGFPVLAGRYMASPTRKAMESLLDEECGAFFRLHVLVRQYLEARFMPKGLWDELMKEAAGEGTEEQ